MLSISLIQPLLLTYLKNFRFILVTSIRVIKGNFYFKKVNNVLELRESRKETYHSKNFCKTKLQQPKINGFVGTFQVLLSNISQ